MTDITRLEVIDHTKERIFAPPGKRTRYCFSLLSDDVSITTDLQDEGNTLKVFINDRYR